MNMVIISENKIANLTVIISKTATAVEITAAEEICEYLKKASGATFEIKTESAVNDRGIYIGHTKYADRYGLTCTDEEEWYIKAHDGNLIISGGSKPEERGVLYGVYHFLEDVIGIRWWNYHEEYIPYERDLQISADFFAEGKPYFAIRQISDIYFKRDLRTLARLRQHGDCGKEQQFELMTEEVKKCGNFVYGGGPSMVHTTNLYIPPEEYFEKHPNWFAWDSKFKEHIPDGQHCFSNDELVNAMSQKVMEAIEKDRKAAKEKGLAMPTYFSVSLADCNGQCECEACRESEAKSGRSGHVLKFVNKIARKVAEKYPDVYIETLAYMLYHEPPLDDTIPEKNVMIRLADIYVDLLHDIKHKNNSEQLWRLNKWSEICAKNQNPLVIWDYLCYQFPFYPMPMIFKYFESFKVFKDAGVYGFLIENHECANNGMWALQEWILSKLMESPDVNQEELLNDFIYKYYGEAGESVKKYLTLVHNASLQYGQRVILYISSSRTNYIDLDLVLSAYECMQAAMECVKDDEVLIERVKVLFADLYKVMVLRYKDFKKEAQKCGKSLPVSRKEAVSFVLEAYDICQRKFFETTEGEIVKSSKIELEKSIFFARCEEEKQTILPLELAQTEAENIYDISFCDILRFNDTMGMMYQKGRGAFDVMDPAASDGRTLKLCYDQMYPEVKKRYGFKKRGELPDVPLTLSVKRTSVWDDEETPHKVKIYKDELHPDEYALYSLKGIKNVTSDSDSTFSFVEVDGISMDLSAVSQILPAEEYEIHVRMKFTGEIYGGKCATENAIYLDRIYVVKVK